MLPNFIGLGAARAGSTWIGRNLRQHPEVFVPWNKEVHFFDRHYEEGLQYYDNEFSGWSGEAAVGDITPQYFHNPTVAPRIQEQFPETKMFVCLRNPVERAYSHYWNVMAKLPPDEAMSFEEKLDQPTEVWEVGYYYKHLTRYYELFPKENILVLLFDDLEADPEAFLRQIFSFLEVDAGFVPPSAHHRLNVAASKQNLGRSKLLWHLYRGLLRLNAQKAATKINRANRRELPPMQQETRERLVEAYREPNELLQELIGRDLSQWNR